MFFNQTIYRIRNIITEVEEYYQITKGLILNESDLKCILYSKLFQYFGAETETLDKNINSISLHTEIPFFNENDKLVFKPDIVLIETYNLSILNSRKFIVNLKEITKLPSKGYIFGGNSIIIELKFCRNKNGITKSNILSYKKDIQKIKQIQNEVSRRTNNQRKVYGFFVVFNKSDKYHNSFDEIYNEINSNLDIEIIYKSGKVKWA